MTKALTRIESMSDKPTGKKNKDTNIMLRTFLHELRSYELAFPMQWLTHKKKVMREYYISVGRKGKELDYAVTVTHSNAVRRIHHAYDAVSEVDPDAPAYWEALATMKYQEFISLVAVAIELPSEHCDDRSTLLPDYK